MSGFAAGWDVLLFLEHEPVLARIWVVHALHGGPQTLERRERVLARLAAILDEGRQEGPRGGECTLVTARSVAGALAWCMAVAQWRSWPLTGLLDELMGMIALQYRAAGSSPRTEASVAPAPHRVPNAGWEVSAHAERDRWMR